MAEEIEGTPEEVAKVTSFIDSRVQSQVEDRVRAALAEMQQQERSPQRQQPEADLLRQTIEPYFKPGIDEARLDSLSAMDEGRFYRRNPDAVQYEDKIEKIFTESRKAGRPTERDSIYSWLVGQEVRTDPDKYVQSISSKKQAQLDAARSGADIGFNGLTKDQEMESLRTFEKLSADEMAEALAGRIF